jgi:hypothetical protein
MAEGKLPDVLHEGGRHVLALELVELLRDLPRVAVPVNPGRERVACSGVQRPIVGAFSRTGSEEDGVAVRLPALRPRFNWRSRQGHPPMVVLVQIGCHGALALQAT